MGSPMSMGGGHMVNWNSNDQSQPALPDNNFQESGVQLRSMGRMFCSTSHFVPCLPY